MTSQTRALDLIAVLADDPSTVEVLRQLIETALHTRRDLFTARNRDDLERVRQLRRLVAALWPTSADASDIGSGPAVAAGEPSCSPGAVIVSAREAAEMLQLTTRRVTQLCEAGDLAGEQDAPGRPWRIHADSLHAHRSAQETR